MKISYFIPNIASVGVFLKAMKKYMFSNYSFLFEFES